MITPTIYMRWRRDQTSHSLQKKTTKKEYVISHESLPRRIGVNEIIERYLKAHNGLINILAPATNGLWGHWSSSEAGLSQHAQNK